MTTNRDELRDKIRAAWPARALTHGRGVPVPPVRDGGNTAACIDLAVELAAEHYAPRVITTMQEVNALPVGSIVMDAYAATCTRIGIGNSPFNWNRMTKAVRRDAHSHPPYLPATVIYTPEENS